MLECLIFWLHLLLIPLAPSRNLAIVELSFRRSYNTFFLYNPIKYLFEPTFITNPGKTVNYIHISGNNREHSGRLQLSRQSKGDEIARQKLVVSLR